MKLIACVCFDRKMKKKNKTNKLRKVWFFAVWSMFVECGLVMLVSDVHLAWFDS